MYLSKNKKRRQRGSALIEISLSYATLVIIALLTLKASVNATSSQAWTVRQSMSDAYITRESALASRISFSEVIGDSSPWAKSPAITTSTVTMGKLPGGQSVTATLHRTRLPDSNNLAAAGGTGTLTTNPAESEAWTLQSLLVYTVGEREYVKSRTVLRIR